MRHFNHQTTSVRCPYDLLIGDRVLIFEELSIVVHEDADHAE